MSLAGHEFYKLMPDGTEQKIANWRGSNDIPPIFADELNDIFFFETRFAAAPRPANWTGLAWPPRTGMDLLTADWSEFCPSCDTRERCNCRYHDWVRFLNRWKDIVELRDEDNALGVAVFAKVDIPRGTPFGSVCGILDPWELEFEGAERICRTPIPIGPRKEHGPQPMAWINSLQSASWTRFVTPSSAEPNVEFATGRHGDVRIVFLTSQKDIKTGDRISSRDGNAPPRDI